MTTTSTNVLGEFCLDASEGSQNQEEDQHFHRDNTVLGINVAVKSETYSDVKPWLCGGSLACR